MLPRRHVEEFIGGEWKGDPERDGEKYCVQIKVNGGEELFNVEVSISGTAMSTEVEGLERILREKGRQEIPTRKITQAVRNGCLDERPPTSKVLLTVESSDLTTLVLPDAP